MKRLILASQSPRRKMLLEQVGIPFAVIPSNVDETMKENVDPCEFVKVLATRKATHIMDKCLGSESAVVLAADTIVVLDGVILGKPKDSNEAFEMLSMISDNWHEVLTGIAMIDNETGSSLTHVEKTRVKIRSLTPEAIRNYIDTGEPLDKAGAYGIQGLGALLVEKLDGCYFNVVGLPLYRVSVMLSQMGIMTMLEGN